MGNILSKIADDYDDYRELCKERGVTPVILGGEVSFYRHQRELLASVPAFPHKKTTCVNHPRVTSPSSTITV